MARMEPLSGAGIKMCIRDSYNIGVIYECLGKKEEALAYYRKCGGYAPAEERIRELGRR